MEYPWKSRAQRLRWGLGVASCTAAVALGVAWIGGATASTPTRIPADPASGEQAAQAAGPPAADPTTGPAPAAGVGRDPLTPAELAKARTAALDTTLRATATDVNGAPGPEYLSFELVDAKAGGTGSAAPRRAAVYFYDYTTNALIKRVVNVDTGTVEGTFTATERQPPPSDNELAKAFGLFLASDLSADFRSRYRAATGRAFTSPDQVEVTATTYVARPADTGSDKCGKNRCVQFITRVPNGVFIDITDIVVDLSGRTVARLS
jgi:hypothetical protein